MGSPSGPQPEPLGDQPLGERERRASHLLPYGYVRQADGALLIDAAAAAVICQALLLQQAHPAQEVAERLNAAG